MLHPPPRFASFLSGITIAISSCKKNKNYGRFFHGSTMNAGATGVGSPSAQRARSDPHLKQFDISGFQLESGEALPPGAKLAYKIFGHEDSSKGIILHPTSFDAVHTDLEYQIGPGKTLDTNQYTVVVANLLGNGVSFSPSTMLTDSREGAAFPHVTVGDNVRLQRTLLGEELKFLSDDSSKLKLIYGYSMGGLQAYEWSMRYPNDVKRIAVVCGASHCSEINEVFLLSLEAALLADSNWCDDFQKFMGHPVKGLRAFATIYAGWGVGMSYYTTKAYQNAGYKSANDFVQRSYLPAFENADANDLLAQIRTWKNANISLRESEKNFQRALQGIKANVLLMPCDTDRYFTIEASQHEAEVLTRRNTDDARVVTMFRPIQSTSGHRAGDPHRPELTAELDHIQTNVHELLLLE